MGILNYKAPVNTSASPPAIPLLIPSIPIVPTPTHSFSEPGEMTRTALPRGDYRRMEEWPKPNPDAEEVKLSPDDPLFNFGSSEKKSIINACVSRSCITACAYQGTFSYVTAGAGRKEGERLANLICPSVRCMSCRGGFLDDVHN